MIDRAAAVARSARNDKPISVSIRAKEAPGYFEILHVCFWWQLDAYIAGNRFTIEYMEHIILHAASR